MNANRGSLAERHARVLNRFLDFTKHLVTPNQELGGVVPCGWHPQPAVFSAELTAKGKLQHK